jgi:hypothetical protein
VSIFVERGTPLYARHDAAASSARFCAVDRFPTTCRRRKFRMAALIIQQIGSRDLMSAGRTEAADLPTSGKRRDRPKADIPEPFK